MIIAVGLLLACSGSAWCGQPLYPACLMNWMVEGTSHALIVEKSSQQLSVWKIENGEPRMIESYPCSTGKNVGDKWVRGDMRTPEGVYFFCSLIDGNKLPPKYGPWAFTTDYPNFIDQRRGKGGDGIWLHGRDKPLGAAPDSNGCIAVENPHLIRVSKFIRLQSTPLIIVRKLHMAPRSRIMDQERELRDFIESWRQSWESRDIERYMSCYSRNFQSCRLDYRAWKEKKKSLNQRYAKIKVRLGTVYLYSQGEMVTALGEQAYSSERFRAAGIKILYITRDRVCRVYSEDCRKAVDNPMPVKALLARLDRDMNRGAHKPWEPWMRLGSTDDGVPRPSEEIEIPRPVAPSRGVMLDRIAARGRRKFAVPTLATNKKLRPGRHERLTISQSVDPGPRLFKKAILCGIESRESVHVPAGSPVSAGATQEGADRAGARAKIGLKEAASAGLRGGALMYQAHVGAAARALDDSLAAKETVTRAGFRTVNQNRTSARGENDLDGHMRLHHPVLTRGAVKLDELGASNKAYFNPHRAIRVETHR